MLLVLPLPPTIFCEVLAFCFLMKFLTAVVILGSIRYCVLLPSAHRFLRISLGLRFSLDGEERRCCRIRPCTPLCASGEDGARE